MKERSEFNPLKLMTSLIIMLLAGIVGAIFNSNSSMEWYATLQKSTLNPPGIVFSYVWTLIYILMAISLYLVWNSEDKNKKPAMVIFFIHFALNVGWNAIFFGLKLPILAFIEMIILWISIAITILVFKTINKTSAYLLIPYIIWVSFALILNFAVIILN